MDLLTVTGFCCFCRMDWTRLEEKLLIEFIILRTNGDKQILKQDPIWEEILQDLIPSITSKREYNVEVVKNKWHELKGKCKAITQMIDYGGYKISKIVDGVDVVEVVIILNLNSLI
jgi:hypothetical protein